MQVAGTEVLEQAQWLLGWIVEPSDYTPAVCQSCAQSILRRIQETFGLGALDELGFTNWTASLVGVSTPDSQQAKASFPWRMH